jgi:nucleoside-diphosphate-sugar epimerase
MRILLTGGNGFIGRYLKQHLEHDIIAPSSSQLDLLDAEAVIDFLEYNQFDAVIHCAVSGRNRVYEKDNSIAENNLRMFYNLAMGRQLYGKFINFGSGAEFGLDQDIELAYEDSVEYVLPEESYGFSKNIITRCILKTPNFFNLRIFACLDPSEGPDRFVTKFKNTVKTGKQFFIDQDRYIDFFTLEDITTVVEEVLMGNIADQDLNLVYQDKLMASDLLTKYCKLSGIDPALVVVTGFGKNYTGDGTRLANCELELAGIDATLARYKD